jgi:hypothetical protein
MDFEYAIILEQIYFFSSIATFFLPEHLLSSASQQGCQSQGGWHEGALAPLE